jgi:integrase
MLDAIDITTPIGLRDREMIALMVYTLARIGAATGMRVDDVYVQGWRIWVRLHKKGGKVHEMPCHHNLDEYVHAYLNTDGLSDDIKASLFRSTRGRRGRLSALPMSQADVYRMIRRRAASALVITKMGCHSFRATGITEYLRSGGKLRSLSRWPITKARARQACTLGARTVCPLIKSSGSRSRHSERLHVRRAIGRLA